MARTDDRKSIRCSFCGKTQNVANRLIAGNGAYICDECIRLCMSIIADDVDEVEQVEQRKKEELYCRHSFQNIMYTTFALTTII